MGRLLTIPATGAGKAGIRKRTLTRTSINVGPVSVQLVVIIVGTMLGLFYLVQSNKLSTQSLELKALEARKTQTVEENERLSIESARLQSLQQIKKATEEAKSSDSAPAGAATARQAAATISDGGSSSSPARNI